MKDPKTGRLANKFVYVANIAAPDAGKSMRAGYERVLTARLSDAWYLYHQDLKTPLEDRVNHLDRVTFFEGLGSIGDKARRIAALAKEIAPAVGADPQSAEKAALLAKADLTTGMVYEFPELQGLMGRYYYLAQHGAALRDAGLRPAPQGQGARENLHPEEARSAVTKDEDLQIADAIRDHYLPKGADDDVPTAPVSVAVALADKIDTLTAFYALNKKPTGSSDPFALRRAALGVIGTVLNTGARLDLSRLIEVHAANFVDALPAERTAALTSFELRTFVFDRLKVFLRENDHKHDLVEATLPLAELGGASDLVLIVRKLEALEAFLRTDDGANLAAGYKRAANIVKAEEKKDVGRMQSAGAGAAKEEADFIRPSVEERLLQQAEEKALFVALKLAEAKAAKAVAVEKFAEAMTALASLRAPIDAFFDKVTVNAGDANLRVNRLALLNRFIAATASVADLSRLEG